MELGSAKHNSLAISKSDIECNSDTKIIIILIAFAFILVNVQGAAISLDKVSLDTPFHLGVGNTAELIPNDIKITILNVEDSRCPADVLCVWQGEAKVSINVKRDSQYLGNFTLINTAGHETQSFDGHSIKLVEVQPYPYSSKEILPSDYVVTFTVSEKSNLLSPLQQFKSGVGIEEIKCKSSYQLVMKKTNGNPACLRPATVATLIERGWAVHLLPEYVESEPKNSELFENGSFEITASSVNYFEDTAGFLAKPSASGTYPGVILIHEWWGLNDNIKDMARSLASHGYVALAVDLYAGQVATTPDGARQLVTTFDSQKGMANIQSASEFLKGQGAEKLATIGWCFGGSQSMNFALSGNTLDATIIYYGQPVTNATQLSKISWPVLGIFGDLDQSIPVEKVNEFQSSLNQLGIQNELVIYPGVGHAFANPSGASYAPEETKDAWQKTLAFLENHLKGVIID